MGMDYGIETKNGDGMKFDVFPSTLSYLFEQVGAYGEKSIVCQMEKLLNIDLSLFQNTYNPEMDFEEEFDTDDLWVSINELINKLLEFNTKAGANKNYFSKLVLNPNENGTFDESNPLYYYPLASKFISENAINNTMIELLSYFEVLKSKGETEIRLVYV